MGFDIGASSGEVCSVRLFRVSVICQCVTFLVPHFGESLSCLKCTKLMGCNSDVVQ